MGVNPSDIEEILSQIAVYFEEFLNQHLNLINEKDETLKRYLIEGKFVLLSKKEAKSALHFFL